MAHYDKERLEDIMKSQRESGNSPDPVDLEELASKGWRHCLIIRDTPNGKLYGVGEDFPGLGYSTTIEPEYESKEDLLSSLALIISDLLGGDHTTKEEKGGPDE